MSMDIRWLAANGGLNMVDPRRRNQLPIYPPGYRAQVRSGRPAVEEVVSAILANADGDELDELLYGGPLEAGALDVLQGAMGIPKSFGQINPGAASYVKTPTVSEVIGGKAGSAITEQQAKDAAAAEQYWRDNPPPKSTGPAMVASAGASPEEIAQVQAYNESKGLEPVVAEQARTKSFLESVGVGVPGQVFDAIKNDSAPTMVASAGASPEEIAQVQAYNEAQGKGPVTAAYVPATPATQGNDLVSTILRTLTGGVVQATGGGPAQTTLGSLLGLGLGGPAFGSGPLPGNLGAAVQNTFGTPGLPPAYARGVDGRLGVTPYAFDPTWQQYAAIGDYAGTTVARSMLGTTVPELQSIRAMLERQAAQVQATHEAAVIASTREFRREVIRLLHQLVSLVIAHDRRVSGGMVEGAFAPRRY